LLLHLTGSKESQWQFETFGVMMMMMMVIFQHAALSISRSILLFKQNNKIQKK